MAVESGRTGGGSRGHGPMRRVLLGGVSSRLMRRAACPVVVVPRCGE
ncbi:MAG TPA: universal stress protein [Solirubrobacteraceae bacterium]|jgi:nucleotide-binding universal stress UspA family protein|nr:universal stress protein [Solirubrobacteraceae bacterium]